MNKTQFIEKILRLFVDHDTLRLNEIAKSLKIKSTSPEYNILKNILSELCDQDILSKSSRRRYSFKDYNSLTTYRGVLNIRHDNGVVDTQSDIVPSIIIKRKNLNTAFEGDTVLVKLISAKKGKKPRGEVIEIIERGNELVPGTIDYDGSFYYLIPDSEKYYIDFLIHSSQLNGADEGDKVTVRLLEVDTHLKTPLAEVVEIHGKSGDLAVEMESLISEKGLITEFPAEVMKYVKDIEQPDIKTVIKDRLDLRKLDIITIDPDDAKDFDDALSLEKLDNGNQKLGVHIADVSYFVKNGTPLDYEARQRGNSIYLVDRVIPMLPEKLSNELCSLKPNRVRMAYSVFMEISPDMRIVDYQIAETIIKSKKRFTYKQVKKILDAKKGPYIELLTELDTLAKGLRTERFVRGGVDFHTEEVKFRLDAEGNPSGAELRISNDATQLVEECMLAANKTVARHIDIISKENGLKPALPYLYRVHDMPAPDKLREVLDFVAMFGERYRKKNFSSKSLNEYVHLFDESASKKVIHRMFLRAMAKAEYSERNIGHYGLGFREYAHFTSPIRRYPDLMVHRLLKEYARELPDKKRRKILKIDTTKTARQCTASERFAVETERASVKLAQTIMAAQYVGHEFEGTVSGVTSFGVFVELDGIYCEGMLHIRDLYDDYYYFDEKNFRLIGKKNKREFKMGGRLKVQIIHVSVEKRKIDLNFVTDQLQDEALI